MELTFAYLEDIYAPVDGERESFALERHTIGEIPKDLEGSFCTTIPIHRESPDGLYHWFDGDGMVHGITFQNGTAEYRNRYVQTEGRQADTIRQKPWRGILEPIDFDNPLGTDKDTANTDLVSYGNYLRCGGSVEPLFSRPKNI